MQTIKRLQWATLTGLGCLLMAGCSGAETLDSQTGDQPEAVTQAQTASASAQPGDEGRKGERRGRGHLLERFDANKDGTLQLSELPEKMRGRFTTADSNGDGALSKEELEAFRQAHKGERGKGHRGHFDLAKLDANGDGVIQVSELPAKMREHLAAADSNGDGTLSQDEMKAFHEAHRGEFAKRGPFDPKSFDANGDGVIQVSELPDRVREHLGKADTNGDGVLSQDELQAHKKAIGAKMFARIDSNGDGVLTADEIDAERWQHMVVADANKDGKLTQAELDAAHESGLLKPPGRGHFGPPPIEQ